MEHLSSEDARRSFAALMEDVLRGKHVGVTRYGRPLAVIVPSEWYQEARKALGMPGEGEQR